MSSSSILPGWTAGPNTAGSRVIVFALDLVGMVSLPAERQPRLRVHANAVPPPPIALERLEPIPGRAREIRKAMRGVQPLELSLDDRPEAHGQSPSGTGR